MNHILYNISLVILVTGIIMLTVYITKATSYNFLTNNEILLMRQNLKREEPSESIYDYRVSKSYEKMFSQPSIWFGYQDFDPENKVDKLYIKN